MATVGGADSGASAPTSVTAIEAATAPARTRAETLSATPVDAIGTDGVRKAWPASAPSVAEADAPPAVAIHAV
ncbi:hypothetical protein RS86_03611 [Microbacterium azadirachtae]|uniref:Uncharacterized protein n=1 Tax=Microbacterium azadirachtae TaxID=582680 RepID=A0A0F0LGK9_9MICO|nr:hypothetical protein RS86_03611 [Microbacterium azadirachtae]